MRKIIKNKVYDTDTARLVKGGLYRKRTGEYFLNKGGTLHPLTFSEAQEWGKKHLAETEYLKEFNPIQRNERKIICSFYLKNTTLDKLKLHSRSQEIGISECLEKLLNEHIK